MEETADEKVKVVKLTKIESNHNNLRTDSIRGWCAELPVIGSSFAMMGPPLATGSVRLVRTSPVQTIEHTDNRLRFRTENSTYELEVLDETT